MTITIETGFPIPRLRHKTGPHKADSRLKALRQAIRTMRREVNSFVVQHDPWTAYLAAKLEGQKVITQKQPKGGWRVWKL